jgi:hypothetical protein
MLIESQMKLAETSCQLQTSRNLPAPRTLLQSPVVADPLTTRHRKQRYHPWQRTAHHTQYGTSERPAVELQLQDTGGIPTASFFSSIGSGVCSNTRCILLQNTKLTV